MGAHENFGASPVVRGNFETGPSKHLSKFQTKTSFKYDLKADDFQILIMVTNRQHAFSFLAYFY